MKDEVNDYCLLVQAALLYDSCENKTNLTVVLGILLSR